MFNDFKILAHQGKRYIRDVTKVELPDTFRGRPVISEEVTDTVKLIDICPVNAITSEPAVSIDLGKCLFCGECALAFPDKIKFTNDYRLATNDRNRLKIYEGINNPVIVDPALIRKEIRKIFRRSLKLRQVSAGGDNSCEWELNAADNVNFDMGRFGIDFVASPRHADGIVITGPITENMAVPLQLCYDAVPYPKIIILVGTDAVSGGIFEGSGAINRSFIANHHIDLYVPGNPPTL